MSSSVIKKYSPQEYLSLEETAEFRSEYRDGEIIPMSGGTTNHNKIAGNLYAQLNTQLDDQSYEVFIADVRLWIELHRQYTYPDVMIIQGKPIYADQSSTTVTNPLLIAEVLSKSTSNYDQGDKFRYYRSISSLQEYLLIDQYSATVMQYVKNNQNQWLLTEYQGLDAILIFNSISFQLVLRRLYRQVEFEE